MARRKVVEVTVIKQLTMPVLFAGLFLIGAGLFVLISVADANVLIDPDTAAVESVTGLAGAWVAYGVILTCGTLAAYVLAAMISLWGVHVIRSRALLSTWPRVLGGVLIGAALPCGLSSISSGATLTDPLSGGLFATVLAPPLLLYLGSFGVLLIASGVGFLGAVLAFGGIVFDVLAWTQTRGWGFISRTGQGLAEAGGATMASLRPHMAAMWEATEERALVLARQAPTADSGTLEPMSLPRTPAESKRSTRVNPSAAGESRRSREAVEVAAVVKAESVILPAASAASEAVDIPVIIEAEAGNLDASALRDFEPYATAIDAPAPSVGSAPEVKIPVSQVRSVPRKISPKPVPPAPKQINQAHGNSNGPVDYQLPPMNTLDPAEIGEGEDQAYLKKRAKVLENTLAEFKIEGRVVQIQCGPRVTMFEMMIAPGVKLSRIISLADNICMSLKAANVRIVAPIPGKDTIGIETPNVAKELVCLREIVESLDRAKRKQILPICLAKDVGGKPLVADLAKMPHLLIAGATGSGKSVCINSVILSFLMCCRPDELKLILVDPKVVELSRFKTIPHLMSPVITDMKRAVAVLEWACQKMDERYEQLAMVNVNNIAKFNALGEEEIAARLAGTYSEEELDLFPKTLPYVVIVIDELADMMMVAGKDVEQHITRLAAKSRAVGIHLILATQRPSVDVITGLIKANMPSRIAFQVASKVDSRTILDQNGAETLLGAGDMLFLPPGVGKVARAQGVFVSDEELFRVVDFCTSQMAPSFHTDLEGPVIGGGTVDVEEFDDRFVDSGLAVLESGRGSVSLLQRKLGIGYGRAARIIDQLAAVGVLGAFREGKAREILMTTEEFRAQFDAPQAQSAAADEEPLAGLRDDEKGRDDVPWDD